MTHSFTLLLEGPNPIAPENLDRLFEAGCDDATFGERDGVYFADFDRTAPSFAEALVSAITQVEKAVPGLRAVRVEPETLVTASEIAQRTKRTRENVRQLFEGTRGPGGFPTPVAWLSDRTRLWRWNEVAKWLSSALNERIDAGQADVIAAFNALAQLREVSADMRHEPSFSVFLWRSDQDRGHPEQLLSYLKRIEGNDKQGTTKRRNKAKTR